MSRAMNYHQVMNVGNDNSSRHLHTNSTNSDDKNKRDFKGKQLVIWLAGLLLSCIPLLAVPFYDLLYNNEFWGSLYNTFCGCEILFLGISLAVSALNDFLGNPSGILHRIWTIFTILFIILGSIIYGIVVLQNRNNIEPNQNTAFIVNVVYLGIIFILGLIRYIASMFGGKNE